jgi:hypothetical protein
MVRNYIKIGGHGGRRSNAGGHRPNAGRPQGSKASGSNQWCITLNNANYSTVCFGEWVQVALGDNFKAVTIGKERYKPFLHPDTHTFSEEDTQIINYHQHIYLELKEPMATSIMNDIIREFNESDGFDLQFCKSKINWLLYITKEDFYPYVKNVSIDLLSFGCRCIYHAHLYYSDFTKPISPTDSLVLSSYNRRNDVIAVIKHHQANLRRQHIIQASTFIPNVLCKTVQNIVSDFNKNLHIYIYGYQGLGKTQLIEHLMKNQKFSVGGISDRFFFQAIPEDCQLLLFDDFILSHNTLIMSTLLRIMDKLSVTISIKCEAPSFLLYREVQVIFLSNLSKDHWFNNQDSIVVEQAKALFRRCSYFEVTHSLFTCTGECTT